MELYEFKNQKALIERGNSGEISRYIEKHGLYDEGSVALIKRGNYDEIMFAIANKRLCDYAGKTLVERGKHDEIMLYIRKYGKYLSDSTRIALMKRGNKAEIDAVDNP